MNESQSPGKQFADMILEKIIREIIEDEIFFMRNFLNQIKKHKQTEKPS